MTSTSPIIVFVHGAWHFPATYAKFVSALRSSGHEVRVPTLTTMNGDRPPTSSLETDSALIHNTVEQLANAGEVVIVVMHSYGGMVGTNGLRDLGQAERAEKGLPGGVSHLVYVCAFALPEGGSMVGKVREFGHENLLDVAFDFAKDQTCLDRDPKTLIFGPGVESTEAEDLSAALGRWNGSGMFQEVKYCAWRHIPITYIYTTNDMTVPYDYQKSMVDTIRSEGFSVSTEELASGHSPWLEKTEQVVEVVNKVAKKCG